MEAKRSVIIRAEVTAEKELGRVYVSQSTQTKNPIIGVESGKFLLAEQYSKETLERFLSELFAVKDNWVSPLEAQEIKHNYNQLPLGNYITLVMTYREESKVYSVSANFLNQVVKGLSFEDAVLLADETLQGNKKYTRKEGTKMIGDAYLRPFGYKTSWLAVRSDSPEQVVKALRLEIKGSDVAWNTGIQAAAEHGLFVSPSIEGWILVVGTELRNYVPNEVLAFLSETFEEVQFFASQRVASYYEWVLAKGGSIVRHVREAGDQGEALIFGDATPAEVALVPSEAEQWKPNEETVLKIAEEWSINPMQINMYTRSGNTGLICE